MRGRGELDHTVQDTQRARRLREWELRRADTAPDSRELAFGSTSHCQPSESSLQREARRRLHRPQLLGAESNGVLARVSSCPLLEWYRYFPLSGRVPHNGGAAQSLSDTSKSDGKKWLAWTIPSSGPGLSRQTVDATSVPLGDRSKLELLRAWSRTRKRTVVR